MTRPMSPEKLGQKGESRFQELCTDAGLVANKSLIDEMGWDFLVEQAPVETLSLPFDKRPPPFQCKVQVKTVWDNRTEVALKLSAAERLAKSRMPTFIIVLSVDKNLRFVGIRAFHMLDRHLARVLERLRKAAADGSLKINDTTITFRLNSGAFLATNGGELREFLIAKSGASDADYHLRKEDQLKNLGFHPQRYEGKFSVKAKNETEIAEMLLGMRSMDIISFEAKEIRFGIKLPSHAFDSGQISISPQPLADCRIVAKGLPGTLPVSIPGRLFASPFLTEAGFRPVRISTTLFEVSGAQPELSINTDATTTTPATIKELLSTFNLYRLMAAGGGRFSIFANKNLFWESSPTIADDETFETTAAQVKLIERMASILKAADRTDIAVTFSGVVDNQVDVMFLSDLIAGDRDIKFQPITISPIEGNEIPPVSEALFIKAIPLGDHFVAYYAVMDVSLESKPPDYLLSVQSMSLRDVSIIENSNDEFYAYAEEARWTTGISLSLKANIDLIDETDLPI